MQLLARLIIANNRFQFDSFCIFFSFFFSSTRSNSPGIINPRDGITYSDVAFSALSHGGRYIVDFSLLASQIGKGTSTKGRSSITSACF